MGGFDTHFLCLQTLLSMVEPPHTQSMPSQALRVFPRKEVDICAKWTFLSFFDAMNMLGPHHLFISSLGYL